MNYKHTKTKKTKSFSLLIVPQSNDVKQFNVASWIPKLLILLIIITISSSSFFIYDLYTSFDGLEKDYLVKKRNLEVLTAITTNQREEIANLEATISEFNDELQAISELQQTVKHLVGLDQQTKEEPKDNSKDDQETTSDNQEGNQGSSFSRGGESLLRRDSLKSEDVSTTEIEIKTISQMLEQSQKDLSVLINDVEERLDYLEAKPNLEPTVGRISSPFGYRKNPFGSGTEFHTGLDIANWYGTKVRAAGSGVVTYAGYNGGYGRVIVIKHGYGYESIYAHNRKLLVKVGQMVEKGQVISEMGSTGRSSGPHLHFEVRYYSKPVDPKTILNNDD